MRNRLLLVDGDPRSLRVLDVSLRGAGFDVDTASTGSEAWTMLENASPDLIIADTELAGIDGFELCARVRRSAAGANLPFIFVASDKTLRQKIRGLEVGASDYLVKPAYVNEVLARVRALLQRRDRERLTLDQDDSGAQAGQRGGSGEDGRIVRDRYAGNIADITVADLVQVIEGNGRSGIVHLRGPQGAPASIYFRQGKVVDAEVGRLSGIDALSRLFSWQAGTFDVEWKNIRRKDAIERPSAELVIEGMQRLDEWNRLLGHLPDMNAVFEVDYRLLAERLAEIPDEVNTILRLCDGVRTIKQVIEDCAIPDTEALTAMIRLREEGIIHDSSAGQPSEYPPDSARLGGWLGSGSSPFASSPSSAASTGRGAAGSGPVQQSFADRLHGDAAAVAPARLVGVEEDDPPSGVGPRRRRTAPGLGQASPDPSLATQAIPEHRAGPAEDNIIKFPAPREPLSGESLPAISEQPIPTREDSTETTLASAARDASQPPAAPTARIPTPAAMPLPVEPTLPFGLAAEVMDPGGLDPHAGTPNSAAAPVSLETPPLAPPPMTQTQRGFGARPTETQAGLGPAVPVNLPDRGSGRVQQSGSLTARGSGRSVPVSTDAIPETAGEGPPPVQGASVASTPHSGGHLVPREGDTTVRVSFPDDDINRHDALDELGLPPRWRVLRYFAGALAFGALTAVGVHLLRGGVQKPDASTHGPVSSEGASARGEAPAVAPVSGPVVVPSGLPAAAVVPASATAQPASSATELPTSAAGTGAADGLAVVDLPAAAPSGRGGPVEPAPGNLEPARPTVGGAASPLAGQNVAPARPAVPSAVPVQPAPAVPAVATQPARQLAECRAAFARNRIREALTACTAAVAASPNSAEALTMLAHTELNRGRLARANELAQRAVTIDPNLADAYVIIGGVHQDSGQNRDAKAAYRRYLQLAPHGRYAEELRSIVGGL